MCNFKCINIISNWNRNCPYCKTNLLYPHMSVFMSTCCFVVSPLWSTNYQHFITYVTNSLLLCFSFDRVREIRDFVYGLREETKKILIIFFMMKRLWCLKVCYSNRIFISYHKLSWEATARYLPSEVISRFTNLHCIYMYMYIQ